MKKRLILTGTENDGFRHRYSVKKKEEFKEAFIKLMMDLEFDGEVIRKEFITEDIREGGVSVPRDLKISEIEDECWNYNNKKYDVDVFYGRFKIIFVIRTKDRIPMVEHLERKADWIKSLEIKKIKEENKKKGAIVPLRKAGRIVS